MRITIPALTASLLISTAAFAEGTAKSAIDALPEGGVVTLSGTVERVSDEDTFILRDNAGKTIDVHTARVTPVNVGDQVTIKGEKTAELAGIGEEIRAATLVEFNTMAKADAKADVKAQEPSVTDRIMASGPAVTPTDTPYANRNNQNTPPNTAYDVDVNRTQDGINISADRTADVKRDAAGVALPAASVSKSNDTRSVETRTTASVNKIEALPAAGSVKLSGVVASVQGENQFTLEDSAGKTINVQTASAVNVKEGDSVNVSGMVDDRFLGFGRKIESAKVMVVGSNN